MFYQELTGSSETGVSDEFKNEYNKLIRNWFYVHGKAGIFDEIDYTDDDKTNPDKKPEYVDPVVPTPTPEPSKPDNEPPAPTPTPANTKPGQVYDPVFGWVTTGDTVQDNVDNDGDINKQLGTMGK